MEWAFCNDEWVPLSEAKVPADDRAFYFGDGVYEVLRTHGRRPWLLEEHLARFERSARAIDIAPVDAGIIRAAIDEGLRRTDFDEALIYFHVTRGQAPREHTWDANIQHRFFMSIRAVANEKDALTETVTVMLLPDLRWKRCDIKSLNLLPNALARQQAQRAGHYEAVFVNDQDHITEGSATSFFIVEGERLVAPPREENILPGITRDKMLQLAEQSGLEIVLENFSPERARAASEALLTGTTTELIGVRALDEAPFAEPVPGPITRRLIFAYRAAVAQFRDPAS